MRGKLGKLGIVAALFALVLGSQVVGAQGKGEGKLVRSHRASDGGGRPAWVEAALGRSMAHLKANAHAYGLRDVEAELVLRSAEEDDLGLTHVRLDQVKDSVPVFSGQLVTHVDANAVQHVTGRVFDASGVATKPNLNAAQAIKTAQDTHGYTGEFAKQPAAQLVILPDEYGSAGVRLTYLVELLIEDGTAATGRFRYFIDAVQGGVVWSYNAMHGGTGHSLYSGQVSIGTKFTTTKQRGTTTSTYYLTDDSRGGMYTQDMQNKSDSFLRQATGTTFTDADDIWGDFTNNDRATAGVDAHFGAAQTWDYYWNIHGRKGIDGNSYKVQSRVHYGQNYNNAFWNGTNMTYGDGDGIEFSPLVSLDVVGHEITHGMTEKTSDLVYANESGALNESFSDIFGTMVEYYTGNVGTKTPDYLIAEDIYLVQDVQPGFRNMQDPTEDNDPDHYSKRLYPDPCTASNSNDQCGVHSNSGIQNHAFYLLAQGGTNKTSGLTVTGIGRVDAEKIFYRALTVYLTSSSKFTDARAATLRAAADLYRADSPQYNATVQAWTAVGVQ